ncbi:hypothetical protein GGI23_005396, partial [Coemansia sp. RSA 2559]
MRATGTLSFLWPASRRPFGHLGPHARPSTARPILSHTARPKSTKASSGIGTDSLAPVPGLDLSHEKLRRAVFYVPCSEERKIQKSFTSAADCI